MAIPFDVRCDELITHLTEYLEGALEAGDSERLEQHLVMCAGCADFLVQLRATIARAAQLPPVDDAPSEATLSSLLRRFAQKPEADEP